MDDKEWLRALGEAEILTVTGGVWIRIEWWTPAGIDPDADESQQNWAWESRWLKPSALRISKFPDWFQPGVFKSPDVPQ